jgi:hypothetical protein
MKDSIIKRSQIYVVILLLIGLGTITSINGYELETNHQLNKAYPSYVNLSYDDYIIGHWKFNENSGSTAHDSSAHEFDGTIYGASWTSGYSGYALNFDGNNDYVSLDDYAANNLGFNKTDDLIFSLYFKTTQTTKGVMYSVSAPEYNPGSHIAINANGTIEFKMWRLSCGLILTSEGVYNDGQWHYLEVWYNGISANPIVKIYVDDELDNSKEYYVCQFDADMFTKAKIGTRSNDTENYFDGIIDEFKVIKFPGGNEQNPPEISGPDTGVINQDLEFTFVTIDPEDDEIEIFIDWGDGTDTGWIGPFQSGEEVIRTHKYSKNGEFTIDARSQDVWHTSSWSHHIVRIGNQIPEAPVIKGPSYGKPNLPHEFTFNSDDYEGDNVWYWIDWGDGDIEEWIGDPNGFPSGEETEVTHIWEEKDIYEIKAKAKDEYDRESDVSTISVRIGNEVPIAPTITGETRGELGVEYEYTFLSTDPDGDNIYYWIKWGDATQIDHFGPYASGTEVTLKHTWYQKGTVTITSQAEDEIGDFSEEGQFIVTMPKVKGFYFGFNLIKWIFERFPILKEFLGL